MPKSPEETRTRLIRAAEKLFAERGIEAVSLREINREAGGRNATALQYHFQDRAGLLKAVLARHDALIEERRHALLDEIENAGRAPQLRELVRALVEPAAERLADPDGGRAYLQIMSEVMNRPEPRFSRATLEDKRSSTNRWRALVEPMIPEAATAHLHPRFTAIRIMFVELARRAESRRRKDDRLFVSHLVDLLTAIVAAPISDETQALLDGRG